MQTLFSKIIKAALILGEKDAYGISAASAIRLGRVRSIVAGRVVPTPEELRGVLSAAGLDASRLTALLGIPETREKLAAIADVDLAGALISMLTSLNGRSIRTFAPGALQVDRLSFTFDVFDQALFLRRAQALDDGRANRDFDTRSKLYCSSSSERGLRLDFEPRNRGGESGNNGGIPRFARLEFNPSSTELDWGELRELISTMKPESSSTTRIDVAVDERIHISEVQALSSRHRKLRTYLGEAGIETSYLVGRVGYGCLRIYDKAEQLRQTGCEPRFDPLTRFEAEVRRTGLTLETLANLPNPFHEMRLVPLKTTGMSLEDRLLVQHAQVFGLLPLKAMMEPAKFEGFIEMLEKRNSRECLPHPRDIFDLGWRNEARSLLAKMGLDPSESEFVKSK
jgi:hypothetical protein